jgi:hypothetical protein
MGAVIPPPSERVGHPRVPGSPENGKARPVSNERRELSIKSALRSFLLAPIVDTLAGLERVVTGRHPWRSIGCALLAMLVVWWVYVPVHELLHVAACRVSGGEVTELQIAPWYGGALFARVFPFVVSGGEYAGRLTGFDTKGSDWVYLITDFGPFVLSILIGVPLMKLYARRRRPFVFGAGCVVGLAPFYNLPGDYHEMGSILTTRIFATVNPALGIPLLEALRSDDVFRLCGDIIKHAPHLPVEAHENVLPVLLLVALSVVVGIVLALATYAAGGLLARFLIHSVRRAA